MRFVRTDASDIVVRPIRWVEDLRGILAVSVSSRSATERLREERERDEVSEEEF